MIIPELAESINKNAFKYRIGELQSIRKKIKHKDKKASRFIFDHRTITNEWAFHYGGRTEIQFNIGLEEEGIRYGLAFSLEPSQSLPDVSILFPKIFKLNCLIHEQPELFSDYEMWHWQDGRRSKRRKVSEIEKQQTRANTFIFFGKIFNQPFLDVDEILKTFDNLLDIYTTVEGTEQPEYLQSKFESKFVFEKKQKNLPQKSIYSSVEKEISVTVRHSFLQLALVKKLEKEYGEENVSLENNCRGNRIDVVVRNNNEYYFYEIKIGSTAKSCIRQAMGQLLEYAYGDCKKDAAKVIVVGEPSLDSASKKYLTFLNSQFSLPIDYIKVTL